MIWMKPHPWLRLFWLYDIDEAPFPLTTPINIMNIWSGWSPPLTTPILNMWYVCVTVAWPPRIHQTISENHCGSHSDVPTDHLKCNVQTRVSEPSIFSVVKTYFLIYNVFVRYVIVTYKEYLKWIIQCKKNDYNIESNIWFGHFSRFYVLFQS